jgi:hypothetical protein
MLAPWFYRLEFGTVQAPPEVFSGDEWRKTMQTTRLPEKNPLFTCQTVRRKTQRLRSGAESPIPYSIKKYQGYRGGGMIVNLNTNLANN